MKKLPKVNTSKLLKAALPYILVGLMATKLGQAYRMASGGDVLDRIFGAFLKIGEAFANPLPSLHPFDLLVGDACGALLWFIVYQKSKNARKYRRGAEYGTARWGNAKDIEPFIDPDFSQNKANPTDIVCNAAVEYGYSRTALEQRLKAKVCELCGTTESDCYEVHHVNKLKNLKGKQAWEVAMIAKRRKTLVVCKKCHVAIHNQ